MSREGFLGERRLFDGPWQAFERDVARLMIANGFDDVRVVGGSGDRGGDVLGVRAGELWVFQCKHTTTRPPPVSALDEVVEAGSYYKAQRLVVATSRMPGDAFESARSRYAKTGLGIEIAHPRALLQQMAQTPDYAPARKSLRPYQEPISQSFQQALVDTGRAQIIMATGLGKTIVMADAVASLFSDGQLPSGRVLVLAHTRDLVDQLQKGFWHQLPKWIATHRMADGEMPSYWDGITFATIQSALSQLQELPIFDLVLVDEAHHVGAGMFRKVIDALKPDKLGGVTATPWRGDGFDIDTILGPPLAKVGIAEGLRGGFLAEVDYRLLADNLDWKLVQALSAHEYSLKELNRRLIIPVRDEEAIRQVRKVFEQEKRHSAIVFSPTIQHAQAFAAQARHHGFKAEAISSEQPPRERDLMMSRFRRGELDLVCTVDLFNEGVDVPDVDMLVFLRVTHSRRIFVQQLGRGLRLNPGSGKSNVVVLDFVTDLRRVAEVIDLDRSVRGEDVETLGLGQRIVEFRDASAGTFLKEWMLDQASLELRQEDSSLELPDLNYPTLVPPGSI